MHAKHVLALVLLVALVVIGGRGVAQANPISCCGIMPWFDAGPDKTRLTVTVPKMCLRGAPCPTVAELTLFGNGEPRPLVWTLVEDEKECVHSGVDDRPETYFDYRIEVPEDGKTCVHTSSVGLHPDLGVPDGMIASDAAGKDAAATRARPCHILVVTAAVRSVLASAAASPYFGLALLLALRRCDRRRDH